MSTGGTVEDDVHSCITKNEQPSPSQVERLKSEAGTETKTSSDEGGRLKFFIGI